MTESPRSVARLRLGSSRDIDQLKDLWLELHAHHAQIMPGLAPYQAAEDSWATRREHYEDLLGRPGTDLVLCTLDTKLVGYGLSHVRPAADTWLADTWLADTWVTGTPRRGDRVATRPLTAPRSGTRHTYPHTNAGPPRQCKC